MTGGDDKEVFTANHTTTIMDTKEDIILVAGAETESSVIESDPKSLQEACACQDWPQWQKAMDKEIDTLEHAGTWVNVPHPTNHNIVISKWVFHVKRKANGEIDKYKVCLVAHGFIQIYGIDYYSTYSPVAKMACTSMVNYKIMKKFIWSHHWAMKTSPPAMSNNSKNLLMASSKQANNGMIHCCVL